MILLLNISIDKFLEIYRIMSKRAMNSENGRGGAVPQGQKISVNPNNAKKAQGKNAQDKGGCC